MCRVGKFDPRLDGVSWIQKPDFYPLNSLGPTYINQLYDTERMEEK